MKKPISCVRGGHTLRGICHIPDKEQKQYPTLILFHDFTGNKTENRYLFTALCQHLEEVGFASFRFDFMGSGESDGSFDEMTVNTEIADAQTILSFVQSQEFVDSSQIHILGYGLGGVVATVLANAMKEQIASLCVWAPAINLPEDSRHGKLQGTQYDIKNLPPYLNAKGLKVGLQFLEDGATLDIFPENQLFDKTVFIVHGEKDALIPLGYVNIYLDIYGEKARLTVVSDASHTFETIDQRQGLLENTLSFYEGLDCVKGAIK